MRPFSGKVLWTAGDDETMVCTTDAPSSLLSELLEVVEGSACVGRGINRLRDAQSATLSCYPNTFDDRRIVPLVTLGKLSVGPIDASTLARRTRVSIVSCLSFGGPLTLFFASHGRNDFAMGRW